MANIRLETDFLDYYDHHFMSINSSAVADDEFRRFAAGGPQKPEQFLILDLLGWPTPPHGTVGDLMGPDGEDFAALVVYTQPEEHRGTGKVLVEKDKIDSQGRVFGVDFMNLYASVYVGPYPLREKATSYRFLGVGDNQFVMRYTGYNPNFTCWLSNNAQEVETEFWEMSYPSREACCPRLPLWAIDVVYDERPGYRGYKAVDFNIAPGLKDTPVFHRMTPKEVYQAIEGHCTRKVLRGEY